MIEILVKGYIRMSGFPRSCHFLILFFFVSVASNATFFLGGVSKNNGAGGATLHWTLQESPIGQSISSQSTVKKAVANEATK